MACGPFYDRSPDLATPDAGSIRLAPAGSGCLLRRMGRGAQVGIIGAGVAGMAAAFRLSQAGIDSLVIDKSRGVSGRAATRRRDGICFDHGANYFRLEDPEVASIVRDQLPTDGLAEIDGPVWVFDDDGRIREGDPAQNAPPKWTYRRGISTLGKLLQAGASRAELRKSCRITGLARESSQWTAIDERGVRHGPFEVLLLTMPAPQVVDLLVASRVAGGLAAALGEAEYHPQFSWILGFAERLERPHPFHALVNTGGGHPVAWLSFEEDKPGHVPGDRSVLVVQMAPGWTRDRWNTPREELLPQVLREMRSLLGEGRPEPSWWDAQRWRYAHPCRPAAAAGLSAAEPDGLFVAGDGTVGRGRVPLALKSGLAAAERIRARLAGPVAGI
jgi:predicted NAD/FAD-dependent oxidoreductase